ncbi:MULTISPECIES: flagellar assembly peptidoglycan hydrolase FlgJ [unclassified Duganella]|uniref:flagellar assembly peptidoglycan hydrolase FlgJ n=1 Tax=unclassified Duganella TaxID=2636909 RepID=UPI0006F51FA4|nr:MULTISPECIES: flagellar assembly peptidoglycan hydrolase FlgJ [unclassified Duganella]KQV54238.1 flagellar biosynthesis protein FlgJ [Duganella sp. Root336D2]KRC03365.1 flagellar biosynthesis protein FlgJ [Duganella sp. Root198D2]
MIPRTATADLSSNLAMDTKGMSELRQSARAGSPEALKATATQFEAMFVNMMMKSMRDATPQDGLMDSQQSKMFTTMLDQQTSQDIAKKGLGLADVLVRQLSKTLPLDGVPTDPAMTRALMDQARLQRSIEASGGAAAVAKAGANPAAASDKPAHVRSFQDKLSSHAEEASRATGIPAKFMLGQAALETGWGRREIKGRDGSNSHNLFGIKAGPDWKGRVVETATTEYINGKAQTRVEKFRAYDSYADSFKDYARLLSSNPRYEKALAAANGTDAAGFAMGLQRAGYATDPNYASKLAGIIKRTLA